MSKSSKKRVVETIHEGVFNFEENIDKILKANPSLTIQQEFERAVHHDKYHGEKKPGCLLVKKRREAIRNNIHDSPHYLDIYTCLFCGEEHECLSGGWEIGWFGGTESKKLN